jgi:hypothetical protein
VPVALQNLPSCLQLIPETANSSSTTDVDSAHSSGKATVTVAETLALATSTPPSKPQRLLTTSAGSTSSRMSSIRRGSTFWVPALGTLTLKVVLLQPTAGTHCYVAHAVVITIDILWSHV